MKDKVSQCGASFQAAQPKSNTNSLAAVHPPPPYYTKRLNYILFVSIQKGSKRVSLERQSNLIHLHICTAKINFKYLRNYTESCGEILRKFY